MGVTKKTTVKFGAAGVAIIGIALLMMIIF